ncbi:hypothetical protein PMAYCL1PPCAC_15596, partial [Pristionchus mayeri]
EYQYIEVLSEPSLQHMNLFKDRMQVQPNKALFFKQLCGDGKAAAFLFSGEKHQRSLINESCALSPISISMPERMAYKPFETFSRENLYNILTSRNFTTRRLIKKINGVILRMFEDEKISEKWSTRSVESLRHYMDDQDVNPTAEYHAMSLERLSIIFYLLLVGLGATIAVLAVEIVYFKLLHRHSLISNLRDRSSALIKKYSV